MVISMLKKSTIYGMSSGASLICGSGGAIAALVLLFPLITPIGAVAVGGLILLLAVACCAFFFYKSGNASFEENLLKEIENFETFADKRKGSALDFVKDFAKERTPLMSTKTAENYRSLQEQDDEIPLVNPKVKRKNTLELQVTKLN